MKTRAAQTSSTTKVSIKPVERDLSPLSLSPLRLFAPQLLPLTHHKLTTTPPPLLEDAPWLGMSYCNGTSDTWVLCDQDRHPETIVSPDPCSCPTATASRTMTLAQSSQINNVASLPRATGLTIAFQPGYYPSNTNPATSSSASTSSASSSSDAGATPSQPSAVGTISALPTASPDTPPPARLSTSATIGTAVGAAVFGLLVVACLGWCLVLRRRRHQRQALDNSTDAEGDAKVSPPPGPALPPGAGTVHADNDNNRNNNNPYSADDVASIGVAYGGSRAHEDVSLLSSPHPSELDSKAARPWSQVSELDGGSVVVGPRAGSMMAVDAPGRMDAILEQGQGHGRDFRGYRHDDDGDDQGRGHARGSGYDTVDTCLHGGHSVSTGQGQGEAGPSELPAESIAELYG